MMGARAGGGVVGVPARAPAAVSSVVVGVVAWWLPRARDSGKVVGGSGQSSAVSVGQWA